MLYSLKKKVYTANLELERSGLVKYTWGNVSGIDRREGLVVIKPSGIKYADLKPEDMVVVDMDGHIAEGTYRPSTDTLTHLKLYNAFPEIGGIVHTHSTYATAFAQAGLSIPALGTTHADCFYGDIPCTRILTQKETEEDYEVNTGNVIVETVKGDVLAVEGVLVNNHGPFSWGVDAENAVFNASVLEQIAKMALLTFCINPDIKRVRQYLLDKHYDRKHGENAYYGQNNNKQQN